MVVAFAIDTVEDAADDNDDIVLVSDCCGEEVYEDYGICSSCKDHCGTEEQ